MLLGMQCCWGCDANEDEMLLGMRCCWVAPLRGAWDRQTLALRGAWGAVEPAGCCTWGAAPRSHTWPPAFPAGCNGSCRLLLGPILFLVQSLKQCKALGADPAPVRRGAGWDPWQSPLWVRATPGHGQEGVGAGAETQFSTPQGC